MDTINLQREASIKIPVSHLLVIWEVLANKVAQSSLLDALSAEERSAIWHLQDVCETALADAGVQPLPASQWMNLIEAAKKLIPNRHTGEP